LRANALLLGRLGYASAASRASGGRRLKTAEIAGHSSSGGVDSIFDFAKLPDPRLISVAGRGESRAFFDKSAVGTPRGCFAQGAGHGRRLKRKSPLHRSGR